MSNRYQRCPFYQNSQLVTRQFSTIEGKASDTLAKSLSIQVHTVTAQSFLMRKRLVDYFIFLRKLNAGVLK